MHLIYDPATKREVKTAHMEQLAVHREKLYREPDLRQLFLELTLKCNERCLHCGSWCTEPARPAERPAGNPAARTETGGMTGRPAPGAELPVEVYHRFLEKIRADFDIRRMMLCITGGEPLLRREFFEIMNYAGELGFSWGMTTNATLIDREVAAKLKKAGMKTVSVSIDGLPETHDRFRQTPGAFDRAMRGLKALLDEGDFKAIQVTTVVHHQNIGELDRLYEMMCGLDIDSWRVINMEPMGRALLHPELMLTPEDYRRIFSFIREKRDLGMPLEYGCSHYLGYDYEHEVREWYFLCSAGLYVASIMANGDIGACLDIERRPELIQGNILRDDFTEVWKRGFQVFRRPLSERNERCRTCPEARFCAGDAHHSWNYDLDEPRLCFRDILF